MTYAYKRQTCKEKAAEGGSAAITIAVKGIETRKEQQASAPPSIAPYQ